MEIPKNIDSLNQSIWKRFISPNGLVYDYVRPDGTLELPTAEECSEGKPNALSWWTPVENGTFFTGLYMEASVRRWETTHSDLDKTKAQLLANGLLQCASVGKVPGFVARFVLPDGKSHYSMGSDDQTGPWFSGLWRYIRSDIPSPEEKKTIISKMNEVALALKNNGWNLPCDPSGALSPRQYRGSFIKGEFRTVTRLIFVTKIMQELTGDESWNQEYLKTLYEEPSKKEDKTRLEILMEGIKGEYVRMPEISKNQLWIFINSITMLREVATLEKNPDLRIKYKRVIDESAEVVLPILSQTSKGVPTKFNFDWRSLSSLWAPQTTSKEAVDVAMKEHKLWNNKGREQEIQGIREPLCAAWIILLSSNRSHDQAVQTLLERLLLQTDWTNVASSFGIFAECAWYQMHENSLSRGNHSP